MVRNTCALSIMDYRKNKAVNKELQDLRGGRASAWRSSWLPLNMQPDFTNGKEMSLNKSDAEM